MCRRQYVVGREVYKFQGQEGRDKCNDGERGRNRATRDADERRGLDNESRPCLWYGEEGSAGES